MDLADAIRQLRANELTPKEVKDMRRWMKLVRKIKRGFATPKERHQERVLRKRMLLIEGRINKDLPPT